MARTMAIPEAVRLDLFCFMVIPSSFSPNAAPQPAPIRSRNLPVNTVYSETGRNPTCCATASEGRLAFREFPMRCESLSHCVLDKGAGCDGCKAAPHVLHGGFDANATLAIADVFRRTPCNNFVLSEQAKAKAGLQKIIHRMPAGLDLTAKDPDAAQAVGRQKAGVDLPNGETARNTHVPVRLGRPVERKEHPLPPNYLESVRHPADLLLPCDRRIVHFQKGLSVRQYLGCDLLADKLADRLNERRRRRVTHEKVAMRLVPQ